MLFINMTKVARIKKDFVKPKKKTFEEQLGNSLLSLKARMHAKFC